MMDDLITVEAMLRSKGSHPMTDPPIITAARDLLANVNTDNDNMGTYAALQAALDAHDADTPAERAVKAMRGGE